jgi:hypothetical protein
MMDARIGALVSSTDDGMGSCDLGMNGSRGVERVETASLAFSLVTHLIVAFLEACKCEVRVA